MRMNKRLFLSILSISFLWLAGLGLTLKPSVAQAALPVGYTVCASENGTCSFSGTKIVAYGANNSFVYKRDVSTSTPCTNAVFGDPAVGVGKSCYYGDYTVCAIENGTCSFSETKSVAYGANNLFNYKEDVAISTPCTNAVFGDPAAGVSKSCYYGDQKTSYILSYFGGNPYQESVKLAYSTNGRNWTALNNNGGIVNATIGSKSVRDPFILRKQDNKFVVLATQGWDNNSIYVWDSTDLVTFTNERLIRVNNFSGRAWAPQAIWNPAAKNYIVYWSAFPAGGGANQTYYNTTTDFVNFSGPAAYFNPGHDEIDADIQYWNGAYYLYYKDERSGGTSGKTILSAKSNSLNAGSFVPQGKVLSPVNTEGPATFKAVGINKWYMYYDFFAAGGFGLSSSTDINNVNGWVQEPSGSFSLPAGVRHATVVKVTSNELNAIKAKWGQ